jgi:hypothetical protein
VDLVHGQWTMAGSHGPSWTGGDVYRRAQVLTSGVEKGRGEHKDPVSGLTGARAAVWWPSDNGRGTRQRRASLEGGSEGCGEDRWGWLPFIGAVWWGGGEVAADK